jgi:hypothetical protein
MSRQRAEDLINDLKALAARMKDAAERQTDKDEADYFRASVRLVEQKIARLSTIQDGAAKTPDGHIFLSVSELGKGLIEIGADIRSDPEMVRMISEITKKAAAGG